MEPEEGPPNMDNLPQEIIANILGVVDYKSLICLRKVCKPIRFLIHDLKPDIHCVQWNLVVSDSGCSQELIFDLDDDGSIIWIEYHEEDPNGCALVFEDSIKIIPNKSCYDVFEEDSRMVWSYLKSELQELNVKFYGGDLGRFWGSLKQNLRYLKNSGSPLRIKCLAVELAVKEECLIRDILELVDLGSLEKISISHRLDKARWPHENLLYGESLMKTEQWARAKVLETRNITWVEPLPEFAGFERVVTRVGMLDTRELINLIEKLTHSPTFESYQITYRECDYPFWPLYPDTPIRSDQIVEFFKNEIIKIHEDNNKDNKELGIEDEHFMTPIQFFEHLKKHYSGVVDWWDREFEDPVDNGLPEIPVVEDPGNVEEVEEEDSEEMEQSPEENAENPEENAKNDSGSDEEHEGILIIKPDSPKEADIAENAENSKDEKAENPKNEVDDGVAELVQKCEEVFGGFSRNNSEKADDEEEEIQEEDEEEGSDQNSDDDDASSMASEDRFPEPEPPGVFPAMVWFFKMQCRPDQLLCVKHCKWENMFFFQLFPKNQAPLNSVIHDCENIDEGAVDRWVGG